MPLDYSNAHKNKTILDGFVLNTSCTLEIASCYPDCCGHLTLSCCGGAIVYEKLDSWKLRAWELGAGG